MDFRTTTDDERNAFYGKVQEFMLPIWKDAEVYFPFEQPGGKDQFDPQIQFRHKDIKEVVATQDNTKDNLAYNIDRRNWWESFGIYTIKPIGIAFNLSREGEKDVKVFISAMVWQRPFRHKYGSLDHYNKQHAELHFVSVGEIELGRMKRFVEDFLRLSTLK